MVSMALRRAEGERLHVGKLHPTGDDLDHLGRLDGVAAVARDVRCFCRLQSHDTARTVVSVPYPVVWA